jgi:hypothetical protein
MMPSGEVFAKACGEDPNLPNVAQLNNRNAEEMGIEPGSQVIL